jgi:hypothetical protein
MQPLRMVQRKSPEASLKSGAFSAMWAALCLLVATATVGRGDDRLVGIWTVDEGFQIVELLFRSDGRYQLDTKSTDPVLDYSSSERGLYHVGGPALTLTPYDYLGEPQSKHYEFEMAGSSLSLTRVDFPQSQVYQLKPGSREDVLARENVDPSGIGTWTRHIAFYGKAEYTFRPGGYYFLKNTPEDSQFPPEWIRGRYETSGTQLTLKPYGGIEAHYEIDFFGNTLTLIQQTDYAGESATYVVLPGSEAEVRAKAAEAEAYLSRADWHVGVWEIRDAVQTVDLTLRPDGHYLATNATEFLGGIVRGRYTLEPGRIQLMPFVGQGLYARDNGEFGKVGRTRELDYYDGELQWIDLESISQSVTLARKRPGTEAPVTEKVRHAQEERERAGWYFGIWEVHDPVGWIEFTFRPDHRYIAKSGQAGVPHEVERGRYRVAGDKLTLEPYPGLGVSRGFELDLYDGDWFLVGDLARMVVARKIPGTETSVADKTLHPDAMKGERGSILGLWTANMPGQSVELVFRPDGEFRLRRCVNNVTSHDYGLYTVDMHTRTLLYDSRFAAAQSRGLDFYGDTMTIFGGLGSPSTFVVNLGLVDAAIAASGNDDAEEAQMDAEWLTRVPVGPRDPNAVQIPTADIPADPNPGLRFEAPTVLTDYRLYRWLISTFVYFNDLGTIKSVAVVNTREWHFFPTGRVLVRFTNHRAGVFYPQTVVDVTDSWGAYTVEPKPSQRDILHRYADNSVFIESDLGEQFEMTLEDGRRHLFLGKDYQILSEWAAERNPIPCQSPAGPDANLMNTGVSLSTDIPPDVIREPIHYKLTRPASGSLALTGSSDVAGNLVTQRTTNLDPPIIWQTIQTNAVPGGPFNIPIPHDNSGAAFFRVLGP